MIGRKKSGVARPGMSRFKEARNTTQERAGVTVVVKCYVRVDYGVGHPCYFGLSYSGAPGLGVSETLGRQAKDVALCNASSRGH